VYVIFDYSVISWYNIQFIQCCNSEHGQPITQSFGVVIQSMAPAAVAGYTTDTSIYIYM